MPIGNTFPVYLRLRKGAQKRFKSFDHLSNHFKKTCLGSHHSEKTKFLDQIQRKNCLIVKGDSNHPSHVKTTLTCPRKGLVCSPSWGTYQLTQKGSPGCWTD